jgi:hypothetical protein
MKSWPLDAVTHSIAVFVTRTEPDRLKSPAIGTACAVVGSSARLATAIAEKTVFFTFGLLKFMTLILLVRRALTESLDGRLTII